MNAEAVRAYCVFVLATMVAIAILYVISIGPAFRLTLFGYVGVETYWAIYPLLRLAEFVPILHDLLIWYLHPWCPTCIVG